MARQIRVRKPRRPRFTALLGACMVLGLVALMSVPALAAPSPAAEAAHENNGKGQEKKAAASDHDGDADSDSSTAYTEDTDTNDGTANNVADEGDNAHPSGKDRSIENGNSSTQGKSESNPDDSKGPMRYEGQLGDDKPNGPGGTDLADQDGNNGCGNDDDFDDDNNGWCGKPKPAAAPSVAPAPVTPIVPEVRDDVIGRTDKAEPTEKVLGKVIQRAAPRVLSQAAAPAEVLGAALPFTGGAILGWFFAALGLLAAGIVAVRAK